MQGARAGETSDKNKATRNCCAVIKLFIKHGKHLHDTIAVSRDVHYVIVKSYLSSHILLKVVFVVDDKSSPVNNVFPN